MWLFRLSKISEFLCAFQSVNVVQTDQDVVKCKRPVILFKAFFVKSTEKVDCISMILFSRWFYLFVIWSAKKKSKSLRSFPWFIFDLAPLVFILFFYCVSPLSDQKKKKTMFIITLKKQQNVTATKDIHPCVAYANRPRVLKKIADRKQDLSCLNSS